MCFYGKKHFYYLGRQNNMVLMDWLCDYVVCYDDFIFSRYVCVGCQVDKNV